MQKLEIENILNEIALSIINNKETNNYGLLSGLTGDAIFLYEYSKVEKKISKYVEEHVDKIFLAIESNALDISYCSGISGACLGIDFIYKNFPDVYEKRFEFVSNEIENYIFPEYINLLNDKNLDFLYGAIGIAFYFLERLKTGDRKYKKYINEILKHLNNTAIKSNDGIKWKQELNGCSYNISLSHGMASIVIFLSEVLNSGNHFDINPKILLEGGIKYILNQEIDNKIHGSFFPYSSKECKEEGSRLAWCYGDLGVGLAILKASKVLNNSSLKNKAFKIFDFSATRKNLIENLVLDTSICHGTSGIGCIYHDLYLQTNNKLYLNTSNYWITETIKMYKEKKTFHLNNNIFDSDRASLLEGKTGIGLTLLKMYNGEHSDWTKFLLI
jgi:hypothetical protein